MRSLSSFVSPLSLHCKFTVHALILFYFQPRSQGLSSYHLGRARRDPGLLWSRATVTIENIREGSSVIRQFVALRFVALSRHRHHTQCLKVVFGLKF